MKKIEILGANRFESFTRTRIGSRAIIVRDGMILLAHEANTGWWLVPGGGLEEGETPEECCVREAEEETGYTVRPLQRFLTLYEYYEEYRYISHYFVCEVTGNGQMHLTEAEVQRGVEPRWISLQDAVGIFSRHQSYADTSEEKRGTYLREYSALREYMKTIVALRKMTDEEFLHFKKFSIADYAEDLIKGEGLNREQALKNAENEFSGMLPDGSETPDQFLMAIEDVKNGKDIGRIWFSYEKKAGIQQVFLCDFLIYESERRKGYASAVLDEMEQMAKADGCAESVLYVWEHNVPGFSLYQKCGYTAIEKDDRGIYMKKVL